MCCASPASNIAAAADVTSIPSAFPNSCLSGTNAYAAPCSSQINGRCATTSGGSTSSAIIINLLIPLSMALVASLVPFLTYPVVAATLNASKIGLTSSAGVSFFT